MGLNSLVKTLKKEVNGLEDHINSVKTTSTRFEKKKLYNYLGDDLIDLFKQSNAIIAGGAITSLFTLNEINDIDVYFRSKEDAACVFEKIYDEEYIAHHTKKATMFVKDEVEVQLIHYNMFEDVKSLFDAFDFTICMGAFDFKNEEFHFHHNFFKHNAQKILRYNKNTSFPLMTMIRVHKYEERGYKISKPELFRIIMSCMKLDINTYEELKDQIGGMYGVSYDKLFEGMEDSEFSFDKAIDYLRNVHVSDDYFKEPVGVNFDNVWELIYSALELPCRIFKHENETFIYQYPNGIVEAPYGFDFDNLKVERFEMEEVIKPNTKLYKYVKKDDEDNGVFKSFYDESFKYTIGQTVEADHEVGLFFNTYNNISSSSYSHTEGGVLIEVEVDPEDFIGSSQHDGDTLRFKKCKVIREINA